jgi:hypothetical protein
MISVLVGGAAAIAATVAATLLGSHAARVPTSPFGGPAVVHISRVGGIGYDLGRPGSGSLRQVSCPGLTGRVDACFVGTD